MTPAAAAAQELRRRSNQPSNTEIARGSWRSWWPAPAMIRRRPMSELEERVLVQMAYPQDTTPATPPHETDGDLGAQCDGA